MALTVTPDRVVFIDGTEWISYEDLLGPGNTGPLAGYPVSVNEPCGDTVIIRLEAGSAGPGAMVKATDGAFWRCVYGPIWQRYLDLGGPSGSLGLPVSGPQPRDDGTEQVFEGGRLLFTPATGVLDGEAYDLGERQGWRPPADAPGPAASICGGARP